MSSSPRAASPFARLAEAGWLLAVIAVPLFFNVWTYRVFEPDKLTLLRSIALFMAAAGLTHALAARASVDVRAFLRQPLVAPVLVLTAVIGLATATSLTPWLSLTGSFVRLQGLYTWCAYVVVFLSIVAFLRDRGQLERLVTAFILPSLPVALYGIVQKFGKDPMPWLGNVTLRVASTMGNSIFVAAYLILTVPLTLVRLVRALRAMNAVADEAPLINAATLRVVGYLVLLAFQLAAVVLAGSRGPVLGLLGGLFFMFLLLAVLRGERRAVMGVLGLGTVLALFLVVFNLPRSPLAPLRDVPYLGRMGRIFETEGGTGKVRLLIWQGAVDLVASNPTRAVIGWGPESMHVAYNPFYPPELANYESRNASPDRSHNEAFDALVTTGFLGLAAYLLLFTSVFVLGLRSLGLIDGAAETRRFLALWLGGGLLTVGGFRAITGGWTYFGVALPAGMMAGLFIYVVAKALVGWQAPQRPGRLLLVGILASIIAHFIEIHFGIAIAATRTLFFVLIALLALVGPALDESHPLWAEGDGEDEALTASAPAGEQRRRAPRRQAGQRPVNAAGSALRSWVQAAMPLVACLVVLAYDFLVDPKLGNLWIVVWLTGLTWFIGCLIVGGETAVDLAARRGPRAGLGAFLMLSAGAPLVYAASHFGMLAMKAADGTPLAGRSSTSSGLLFLFYFAVLLLLAGWAWALGGSGAGGARPWLLAPAAAAALALTVWTNINEARADIYYKEGQYFHDGASQDGDSEQAILNYEQAVDRYSHSLALDPKEDYYMLFKGKALLEKAARMAAFFDQQNAAQLGDQPGVDEYAGTLAEGAKTRDEAFETAITALNEALAAAPHNPDHTANLARAYQIWGDVTHEPARRKERLALSRQWFEKVIAPDLSPHNAQLREELAQTEFLDGQRDAAFERVDEAMTIDPKFLHPYRTRARFHSDVARDTDKPEDWQKAADDFEVYLAKGEGKRDLLAWSEYGWIQGKLGNLAKAYDANVEVVLLTEKRSGTPDLNTLSNLAQLANDLKKGPQETCNWVNRGYAISKEDKLPEVDPTFSRLNAVYGCQDAVSPADAPPPSPSTDPAAAAAPTAAAPEGAPPAEATAKDQP